MRHLCAITILAAALLKAHAAQNAPAEIPFQLREGLIWVQAMIADSTNHVNFLLDTGAGVSVINRGTADRLGLKLGNPIAVRGVATTLTGNRLKGISAHASGLLLPSEYVAVDLTSLSSSCERSVDGLLGVDFFRGRAVQLDFKQQKLRILADSPRHPDTPSLPPLRRGRRIKGEVALSSSDTPARSDAPPVEVLPLQLRPCGMRVPITVNGQKRQWVRLDTGCATPLQWVTSRVGSQDCNPKVAIGLTEISIPQTQTTVELGQQKFDNVPTGLHQQPIFAGEAGLLGTGLLSRFSRITIDTKSRRLILER